VDREHEHSAGRQQEALLDQRRDHQDDGGHDDDVRGGRLVRGLARHRQPLRHGVPGAEHPRTQPLQRVLAAAAAGRGARLPRQARPLVRGVSGAGDQVCARERQGDHCHHGQQFDV